MSTKTVKTPVGKTIYWEVSLEGYIPQSGSYVMGDAAQTLNINLVSYRDLPLTMEFSGVSGTISNIDTSKNVQYNKNNTGWVTAGTSISIDPGDVIEFKGEYSTFRQTGWILSSGVIIDRVLGNIGSVIDPVNYPSMTTYSSDSTFMGFFESMNSVVDAEKLILPATTLTRRCYFQMFKGCASLTKAPELPSTVLAFGCYEQMFEDCSSLTTAPILPATTLADYCYGWMFWGCSSLTAAPALPATNLAASCYANMFYRCSSLTTAPALPATTLAPVCYGGMFWECTGITTAPALPATNLANACYQYMFYGCTGITTAPALPASTLANYCYGGMFWNCTNLTAAPDLYAETLVDYCYKDMFVGCSSLNYIKCSAHDISATDCTDNWVNGVAPTGTFVRYFYNNDWTIGNNGIPVNWVVETVGMQKHTVTISPTPSDALVFIDGVRQDYIYDWYGTAFTWTVSATHYQTSQGHAVITGDATINVVLDLEQHTFTITPTPNDATVVINGVERSSITADYGTTINWSVSAPHYVSQSGSTTLTGDTTLPVTLVLEQHTFTITPTPNDAVVTINGVQRSSITADYGTAINWSVSKTHYVTQSGSFTLIEDSTLPVSLNLEQHTFTITPNPNDAVVTINGVQRSSITADYGTAISWSVSKTGYVTQSNSFTLTADSALPVSLVLETHTFTITPAPNDAVVTINGVQRSSITADYGTTINWSVSKTHYVTQSGSFTLVADSTMPVTLNLEQHTFTITPAPNDAVVTINGVQRSSITADYGTTINWSVSASHYVSQSGSLTLVEDTSMNVNLALEQFTFSINTSTPYARVTIDDVETTSLLVDYGTTVTWLVESCGYYDQSGSHIVTADYTQNVTLVDNYLKFYINDSGYIAWATTSGNPIMTFNNIEYSIDNGVTWNLWEYGGYSNRVGDRGVKHFNSGDVVLLRGFAEQYAVYTSSHGSDIQHFSFLIFDSNTGSDYAKSAGFTIGGDITTLLHPDYRETLHSYAFMRLFEGLALGGGANVDIDVNDPLVLSSPILGNNCYSNMFSWADDHGVPITRPPVFKAKVLANYCCVGMFNGCKNLTTSPILDVKVLPVGCYYEMFSHCTSISQIICLATDVYAEDCVNFGIPSTRSYGVPSYGILYKDANTTWPILRHYDSTGYIGSGAAGVPLTWTVDSYNPLSFDPYKSYLAFDFKTNGTINWERLYYGGGSDAYKIQFAVVETGTPITHPGALTWNTYSRAMTPLDISAGYTVFVKFYLPTYSGTTTYSDAITSYYGTYSVTSGEPYWYYHFAVTGEVELGGNIMGILPSYAYSYSGFNSIFSNNTTLKMSTDHPLIFVSPLFNYDGLFKGCSSIDYIKCLTQSQGNTTNWVDGVAVDGIFEKNPDAVWTTGTSGIPSGWTVINAT